MKNISPTILTIAILYIVYGFLKLVVGLGVMFLPLHVLEKTPFLKQFVKQRKDRTAAGMIYEYIFLLFGLYTILHGATMLGWVPHWMVLLFGSKLAHYLFFICIGLFMVIFYSLVVYTNLPIPKTKENIHEYKLFGIIGGLSFLIMPVIWEFLSAFVPAFRKMSLEMKGVVLIGLAIVAFIIIGFVYTHYIKDTDKTVIDYVEEQVKNKIHMSL